MKPLHIKLLKLGAIQTVLIAIYHFFIPYQFSWSEFLPEGIATINWSLYALNNYFSFNLLIVALFLLYYLFMEINRVHTIKVLAIIAMLFWIFSTIYQIIIPMPLPRSLSWLSYVLTGLAIFNIGIFVLPINALLKL